MYRRTLLLAAAAGAAANPVNPQGLAPVRAFGPGGPGPAMIAAAAAFRAATGIVVEVTAGPTPAWAGRVVTEADIIFSGAEYMMDDFMTQFRETLDAGTRTTLYLRPVALLVRKGNPRRITGLRNLLSRPPSEARVLATGGAGQAALWEDVAGRTGDIELLRTMRQRIVLVASNTGAAQQEWRSKPDAYDAWLVWNHWQIAAPEHADLVEIEEPFRIWRSTGTVLTQRGVVREEVRRFAGFLASPKGTRVFHSLGWSG